MMNALPVAAAAFALSLALSLGSTLPATAQDRGSDTDVGSITTTDLRVHEYVDANGGVIKVYYAPYAVTIQELEVVGANVAIDQGGTVAALPTPSEQTGPGVEPFAMDGPGPVTESGLRVNPRRFTLATE